MTDCNTTPVSEGVHDKIVDDYRSFVDGLTSFDNVRSLDDIRHFLQDSGPLPMGVDFTEQLLVAILSRVGNNFGNVTEKYDTLEAHLADANEARLDLETQILRERKETNERIEAKDEAIKEACIDHVKSTALIDTLEENVTQLQRKVEEHRKEFADYHNLSIGQMLDAKLKDLVTEATTEAVDNIEVEADDIHGLSYRIEAECEDQINGIEVEADNVEGLSSYVENAIDEAFSEATVCSTIER